MDATSYAILLVLLLEVGIVVWITILGRVIGGRIEMRLDELDRSLAGALQSTLENLPIGDMDFNPINAAIAQWIAAQAGVRENTIEALVTPRDAAGQFAKQA